MKRMNTSSQLNPQVLSKSFSEVASPLNSSIFNTQPPSLNSSPKVLRSSMTLLTSQKSNGLQMPSTTPTSLQTIRTPTSSIPPTPTAIKQPDLNKWTEQTNENADKDFFSDTGNEDDSEDPFADDDVVIDLAVLNKNKNKHTSSTPHLMTTAQEGDKSANDADSDFDWNDDEDKEQLETAEKNRPIFDPIKSEWIIRNKINDDDDVVFPDDDVETTERYKSNNEFDIDLSMRSLIERSENYWIPFGAKFGIDDDDVCFGILRLLNLVIPR